MVCLVGVGTPTNIEAVLVLWVLGLRRMLLNSIEVLDLVLVLSITLHCLMCLLWMVEIHKILLLWMLLVSIGLRLCICLGIIAVLILVVVIIVLLILLLRIRLTAIILIHFVLINILLLYLLS